MKSSDFLSWRKVVGQGPGEYAGVVGEGNAVTFAYLESTRGSWEREMLLPMPTWIASKVQR